MINIMNMINVNVNIMATATGTGTGGNNNNNNNNNNGGSGSGSGSGSGGGNNNNNNNNNGGSGSGSGSGGGNNNNNNNNNGRGFTNDEKEFPTFLVNSRRRSRRENNDNNLVTQEAYEKMDSFVRRTVAERGNEFGSQPNTIFSNHLLKEVEKSFRVLEAKCDKDVPFCELLQLAEF